MSFGGAGQGNIRYSILFDDTQAVQKIGQFKTALSGITQPSQVVAANIGTLNTNLASISTGLTKTNTGFTQTGVASKTLATNLTGVNTGFTTLGTGINGLATPTRTLTTNMGALGNNFKLLNTAETQLVTETKTFQTGMSALTSPTQTVSANMKGLVGNLSPLAGNFQKTSGAAKDMAVQQTNLSKSSTSLGSKIKDNAGRFAGFATGMATVATGTISLVRSFRDLEDNQIAVDKTTRKLSTSQEAVDKITKKLAADTTKYGKNSKEVKQDTLDLSQATQKLNIDTKLHGEALERQSDALQDVATSGFTTLLGVMTTAISGTRDLGLSLKGGSTQLKAFSSAVNGGIGGLKGYAATLGTLAFAAIGAVGTIEEVNAQLKIQAQVANGTITPLQGARKELDQMSKLDWSTPEGIVVSIAKLTGGSKALADILKPTVKGLEDTAKKTTDLSKAQEKLAVDQQKLVDLEKQRQTTGVKQQEAELKITIQQDNAEIARLKTLGQLSPTLDKSTGSTQQFSKSTLVLTSDIIDFEKAVAQSEAAVAKNDSTIAAFGDTIDNLAKKFLALNKAQKDIGTFPTPAAITTQSIPGPFAGNPTAITKKTDADVIKQRVEAFQAEEAALVELGKEYGVASSELEKFKDNGKDDVAVMNLIIGSTIDYTAALTDANLTQKLIAQGFKAGRIEANAFFIDLVKSTDQETSFNVSLAEGASELGIHSSLLAFSSGKMKELIKTTYEQTFAFDALQIQTASSTKWLKDQTLILSQVNDGMLTGIQSANDWTISMIKSTAEGFAFHDQMLKITADMLGIAIPIGTSDAALQKMQKTFEETQDAGLALAEMMTDKLAPSFERVSGLIQSKDMKELRDNLKKLELPKGFNKDIDDAFKPLRGAAEEARQLGNAMDILVTAGANMSKKDLAGNMKAFGNELDRISKIKGTSKPVDAILMSLKTMSPEELGQHTDSIQFLVDTINKFGSLPKDKAKEFIDMYNKETVKMGPASDTAAQGVNSLADALLRVAESNFDASKFKLAFTSPKGNQTFKSTDPTLFNKGQTQTTKITADNSQALKAVDVIAKRIQSLSGIKAIISLVNTAAIKAIDVVAKRINSLTGIQPQISLQNKQAIKTVDVIAKRIDKLTDIKPDISLQNKKAIKAVDVVAKRIDSLSNIKPQINLNNNKAIKAVDVVAKRINDLSNINPTVKVGISGAGAKFAAHGMHETLAQDTLIQAHKGERVDIGPNNGRNGSSMGGSGGSGGGGFGGGDITIINNILDETIMRKINMRSGQNRFVFGF